MDEKNERLSDDELIEIIFKMRRGGFAYSQVRIFTQVISERVEWGETTWEYMGTTQIELENFLKAARKDHFFRNFPVILESNLTHEEKVSFLKEMLEEIQAGRLSWLELGIISREGKDKFEKMISQLKKL